MLWHGLLLYLRHSALGMGYGVWTQEAEVQRGKTHYNFSPAVLLPTPHSLILFLSKQMYMLIHILSPY